MTTPTRNRLLVILILLFPFILFVGFMISEIPGPLPPLRPLPVPNGYDDLVKAGRMISTNSWNFEQQSPDQLRETVSANAGALALARTGMNRECQVPVQYSQGYWTSHVQELAALRSLAQGFAAESRLAEKEGRFHAAVQSALDVIRLGTLTGRGGMVVDAMVGIAIESMCLKSLRGISDQLDAQTCRETITALEALNAQRPAWADVLQEDKAWSRRIYGWRAQWLLWIHYSARTHALQRAVEKIKSTQQAENQLLLMLAGRAYELDKGQPPANAGELVPDYLKNIPQDPFTGTNLVYPPR